MPFTRPEFWAKSAIRTAFAAACPTVVCPRTATTRAAVARAIAARFFIIVPPSSPEPARTLAPSQRRFNGSSAVPEREHIAVPALKCGSRSCKTQSRAPYLGPTNNG